MSVSPAMYHIIAIVDGNWKYHSTVTSLMTTFRINPWWTCDRQDTHGQTQVTTKLVSPICVAWDTFISFRRFAFKLVFPRCSNFQFTIPQCTRIDTSFLYVYHAEWSVEFVSQSGPFWTFFVCVIFWQVIGYNDWWSMDFN